MVDLKLQCGTNVRRFSNVHPNCINFTQFCLDVRHLFPTLGPNFQAKYIDDEGEEVSIVSDMELQEAISMAEQGKWHCLRISVQPAASPMPTMDLDTPVFGGPEPTLSLNMEQGILKFNSSPISRDTDWDLDDPLRADGHFDDDVIATALAEPATTTNRQGASAESTAPIILDFGAGSAIPDLKTHSDVPVTKRSRIGESDSEASTAVSVKAQEQNEANTAAAEPKILRRRARNRVSARKSRMRKKLFNDSLQVANDVLTAKNKALQQRVQELEAEVLSLKKSSQSGSTASPATAENTFASTTNGSNNHVGEKPISTTTLASNDLQLLSQVAFLNKSFCVCDPNKEDNPIVYCSDSFVKLTGYPRSEILGKNCRFLQGPRTDKAAVKVIRDAIDNGCDAEVKILNYRKNGTVFWNDFFIAALRDAENKVVLFVGVQQELRVPKHLKISQSAKRVYPTNHTALSAEQKQSLQQPAVQDTDAASAGATTKSAASGDASTN